ncbi:hypothetical protein UFOVP568_7 [uncultured Caudovirales phage]|uniref:Uncharacterized protein n=1 Tax=uncultured Caudovirales phage TaxID=2100421 RepID=A0A6J5MUA9_9CAUD|nr:hypothetical protein UFOVP568_7 [uncultured Caudovirales phage]
MAKLQNDPVAMATASLASFRLKTTQAEQDFGAFAYHLFHVITDVERMGDAFQVGPDWMDADKKAGREAIVSRCMQLLFPVPDNVSESKDKTLKAAFRIDQNGNREDVKRAVEMLAGMCRMGDLFGETGAQWSGSQWMVPPAWFVDGEISAFWLSGKPNVKLIGAKIPSHVSFCYKNAGHKARVDVINKDGDTVETAAKIAPNRLSIAALGMPKEEREQSEEVAVGTPVVQAGNLLSKLLDQAEETQSQAITGDAADAMADVIARIVRNPHLWSLALAERSTFEAENASNAAQA